MYTKKKVERHRRLKQHIRLRISGTAERPRLTVYKSLRHVYGQIVDDSSGKTILSVSDISKSTKDELNGLKGQMAVSKKIGQLLAQKALAKNITQVVFDRNGYLYHGVIKAIADGAREAGLKL